MTMTLFPLGKTSSIISYASQVGKKTLLICFAANISDIYELKLLVWLGMT